jgi:hypothetical protein
MRFKQFILAENKKHEAFEKWEDLLHHIAEEELIACKVINIFVKSYGKTTVVHFEADCNDDPREEGHQSDLSKKLTSRLTKHKFPGLGANIKAKVFHVESDPR